MEFRLDKKLNCKGFVISHLNVRSLLRHMDEVFYYLGHCDLICLSETWLTAKVNDALLTHAGYDYIRHDRLGKKKGGGLLVYIKNNLSPFVEIMPDIKYTDSVSEEMWLFFSKPGVKKVIIGMLYRPPSGSCTVFLDRLEKSLISLGQKFNMTQVELILLGDFNIDYAKTQDPIRKQLSVLTGDHGLRQVIRKPTRVTNKSRSIIDLLFTNIIPSLVSDSGILEVSISDHVPVYICKKAKRHRHPKKTIVNRNYRYYTKDIFEKVLMDNEKWIVFWSIKRDPDKLWELMLAIIKESINRLCPLRTIVIREDQHPWINKDLRQQLEIKEKLYKRAKLSGGKDDWDEFLKMKADTRKLIVNRKREFVMSTLNETRDCPKQFWREIDKNLHFGKPKNSGISCIRIKDAGGCIKTGDEVKSIFNSYYVSIGRDLASKFDNSVNTMTSTVDRRSQCSFRFVGMKEVLSVIRGLKNNKSTCIGDINMRVMKDAMNILVIEFTHLVNESLDLACMPGEWKVGTVSPIPKGLPSLHPGDYRPVSVLPAPSKVIERLVYNQLIYYLEINCLLDGRQHGFRKGHSTATAVMEVVQFLYKSVDMGQYVHCAYVDYSKAFDTLDHAILCKKLTRLGFDMQIVEWCRNYLTGRNQCVKIANEVSSRLPITCGVPQGSILGPLFFIIYVNDLLERFVGTEIHITLYADDTVLYTSDKCSMAASRLLENGLEELSSWCIENKLTINVRKTKHMILLPSKAVADGNRVLLNGTKLDVVHCYNYLGVIIDDTLTFANFLRDKCNKVNVRIYQLGRMRKYLSNNIASLIYKQTILPLCDYADLMVESGPASGVARLQTLQDRALRIIDNRKHRALDAEMLANLYRISSLKLRRAEHLGLIMYRLSTEDCYIERGRPMVNLRSNNKIKFVSHNRQYEKYLKSPLSRGITLWDRIPEAIQKSTTKVKFKTGIKPHLLTLTMPVLR